MRIHVARREEHTVGKYRVVILYDAEGKILGALIQSPRATKPLYIAANESINVKLPKTVRTFLAKMGFRIER
jgi:hypothetical protein